MNIEEIRADERARVLAEVYAELRDDGRHAYWVAQTQRASRSRGTHADYLRDVLGAGGEREESDAEYFQAREDAEMDEHWTQLEREQ